MLLSIHWVYGRKITICYSGSVIPNSLRIFSQGKITRSHAEAAIEFIGIDPFHPLRIAVDEEEAMTRIFRSIRKSVKAQGCKRAVPGSMVD